MNLILFDESDIESTGMVSLTGRRAEHIRTVHRATVGDSLKVGQLGGKIGPGTVEDISRNRIDISYELTQTPPLKLPVKLIVAMPRPKSVKKVLQVAASAGVPEIHFCHSYKVDKSYWQSPVLESDSVKEHLVLGLEQGVDTVLPEVTFHRYFKPFVEDVVPEITAGSRALIAHPGSGDACPFNIQNPVTIAVGPEGGFIDYEVDKFVEQGFEQVVLGERILRVEYAVSAVLGRLF